LEDIAKFVEMLAIPKVTIYHDP